MGLDMYLYAEKYISGSKYDSEEEQTQYNSILKELNIGGVTTELESLSVRVRVAYWRKANQIHGWFVKNVQGGEDDCKDYYVDEEKLEKLIETCKIVLSDHSQAEKLLPPQKGFFFGGYEYDKYYFEDLQDTIEQLEQVLNNKSLENCEFYYQSSW